jgi:HrpA-like RNA helicase
VDIYGNRISHQKRLEIIETISGLPAASKRAEFLLAVREHPIVIVQGETGSGKTTQLPKYLHLSDPTQQIIVTQPRVIAAMSNATRVAEECLAEYGDPDFSLGSRV